MNLIKKKKVLASATRLPETTVVNNLKAPAESYDTLPTTSDDLSLDPSRGVGNLTNFTPSLGSEAGDASMVSYLYSITHDDHDMLYPPGLKKGVVKKLDEINDANALPPYQGNDHSNSLTSRPPHEVSFVPKDIAAHSRKMRELEIRLQVQEDTKKELVNQCLSLQQKIDEDRDRSSKAEEKMALIMQENEKLRKENRKMETRYIKDMDDICNKMKQLDDLLAARDEQLFQLKEELWNVKTTKTWGFYEEES